MLICPACKTSNADDAPSCGSCNTSFETTPPDASGDFTVGVAAAPPRGMATQLFPGDIVSERYEIIEGLGEGGMGTVYKALDRELDRIIALKTIRRDLASNASIIRRFKQEILLARQVTHRNVIRIFDFGVANGLRFITMEFFEGEDLHARLKRAGKFTPAEAVKIIRQACQGLQAAHAEDVIHRDLKPHNVLVNAKNQVRITDFGLARSVEGSGVTRTGVLVGSPEYMSPEQARGDPADVRSDIFALGLIGYELLTGELPFKGESTVARLLRRTRERAQPPDSINREIPKWLSDIVVRCLEPDPGRRYQQADEIIRDLDNENSRELTSRRTAPGVLAPGAMLGSRYRIETEAGEGGMGKIYRATDLDLNRTVALKVIRPELAGDAESLERLKHEILLASRISHRHVLRIHDLGEADGLRFVSMAWVEGEDLAQFIHRSGPLPENRILGLAEQICEGLEAAHEAGVIHRDLKPRNILLDSDLNAFIADFGVAEACTDVPTAQLSHCEDIVGTPGYMSPEQVEGKPADRRSDIYSLGLILYEMATGDLPFKHDSALQTMLQRVTGTARSPKLLNPAISNELAAIILRCLERDSARRYQSVHDLLADVRHVEEDVRHAALPANLSGPEGLKPPGSRKWLYAAAATIVCAALGIAVYAYFHLARGSLQHPPASGKYIAVLPFHVVGDTSNLKYDAEGIQEAISSRLFSISSVHPISPVALQTVDLTQPLASIAQKVGANLVVHGSIQGEGDHISVTANIQNVELHKWVWSKSFSGVQQDLLTIEDEIGTDVIHALDVKPTEAERDRTPGQPTQNIEAYDLYLKGRDLLKNRGNDKNTTAALELFEQACAKDPSFALAWTGVADASLKMYSLQHESFWAEKALAAARQAKRDNDALPEVHFSLGSVYTQTGKNAEAVGEIQRALQLEPNSDDGYVRLGRAYLATGRTDAALAALKKAVELNPYYWYNHDQLGKAYYKTGRNADALTEFKRVAELDPRNASVHNAMGIIYFRQSLWRKSIPEFQKVIALRPTSDAYTNLGTAYFFIGRYSEAIPIFEKAVEIDPNKVLLIGNLADAYRQAGQREKAQAAYDRAIERGYEQLEVNPRDAATLGNLALYYARKGGAAKALAVIAQARSIDGADNQLMYDEAVVDALAGHTQDALAALKRALDNGYSVQEARQDPDLATVRALPECQALLKKLPA